MALLAAFLAALFWLPSSGWAALLRRVLAAARSAEWAGCRAAPRVGGRIRYAAAFDSVRCRWHRMRSIGLAAGGLPAGSALALVSTALALAFWVVGVPLWLARRPAAAVSGLLVLAAGSWC